MEVKGEDVCWEDEVDTIADNLTSIYTSELAAWIAENGSRASYHDEAVADDNLPQLLSSMFVLFDNENCYQ